MKNLHSRRYLLNVCRPVYQQFANVVQYRHLEWNKNKNKVINFLNKYYVENDGAELMVAFFWVWFISFSHTLDIIGWLWESGDKWVESAFPAGKSTYLFKFINKKYFAQL